jgi:hypothetical protein
MKIGLIEIAAFITAAALYAGVGWALWTLCGWLV